MKQRPSSNFVKLAKPIVSKYMCQMRYGTFSLFIALIYLADMFGQRFHYSDQRLKQSFGLDRNIAHRGRKELAEKGLLQYKPGYKYGKHARATRYDLFPTKELMKELRITSRSKRVAIRRHDNQSK